MISQILQTYCKNVAQCFLFIFPHINKMLTAIKYKLWLCADNSSLFVGGKDIYQIEVTLSRELEYVRECLIDNKLWLNLGTGWILLGS